MEGKIKAILFDFDLTLFDSTSHKVNAVKSAAQQMIDAGLEMGEDEAYELLFKEYLSDFYGTEVISKFLKKHNKFNPKLLAAGIIGYRGGNGNKLEPIPEVLATLKELKNRGLRLAIVSDAPSLGIFKRLRSMGIARFFEEVIGRDITNVHKPSKEPFLEALNRMGLKPEETIYVGDRLERDIKGANDLGMYSVHAKYLDTLSDDSYKGQPDYTIDNFGELIGILQEINQKT